MPPTQDSNETASQRLQESIAANDEIIRAGTTIDETYRREWKKYREWVAKQDILRNGPPWLTRLNVDYYFSRNVVDRRGGVGTIRRIVSALQLFADKFEHVGKGFKVESEIVKKALETQKTKQAQRTLARSAQRDPHKGLKDRMPVDDQLTLLRYIYSARSDWAAASLSFNWGIQGAVRGASNRKLTLCDLNMSFGFGPVERGENAKALLLVIRKGPIHKDRHDTDHQVGAWRHKHFELCSVLSTAMSVVWYLVQHQDSIHFKYDKREKKAEWWGIPFLDWEKYSDTANAFKEIYEKTGVENSKLTHLRTTALQTLGFFDLAPHQTNSHTNHIIDKKHDSAYGPVATRDTLKVSSGFNRDEVYFVPRTEIELPHDTNYYAKRILPALSTWQQQQASKDGDTSSAGRQFVTEMIPWFIRIIVQDGVFLIKDFPNHAISKLLLDKIPQYEIFAMEARKNVEVALEHFPVDSLKALNDDAREAFDAIRADYTTSKEAQRVQFAELRGRMSRVESSLGGLHDLLQRQNQQIQQILHNQQQQRDAAPAATSARNEAAQDAVVRRPPSARNGPNGRRMIGNGNEYLGTLPRLPNFDKQMPRTLPELVYMWNNLQLGRYVNANKGGWPQPLRLGYSRRLYLIRAVEFTAEANNESFEEAKDRLEAERKALGQTLSQFLTTLKTQDNSIQPRNRRKKS